MQTQINIDDENCNDNEHEVTYWILLVLLSWHNQLLLLNSCRQCILHIPKKKCGVFTVLQNGPDAKVAFY